ncbi:protein of unknown function [Shewanella benthica]|uniref:Uncharacterized protein n=1 Tax=Shewanella benthica TaxID=43661 RepID=A0A330LY09_9GAMM|nr:protein of unknown function [Shewanella benthica]
MKVFAAACPLLNTEVKRAGWRTIGDLTTSVNTPKMKFYSYYCRL